MPAGADRWMLCDEGFLHVRRIEPVLAGTFDHADKPRQVCTARPHQLGFHEFRQCHGRVHLRRWAQLDSELIRFEKCGPR